jgi:2'-hydroxyisoflavone reductase
MSVFADESVAGNNEDSPVRGAPDPAKSPGENYGANKAESERRVLAATDGRALIVRPGLIGGPGDPTDRFTYWPVRLARGGTVLAPGDGGNPAQVIDARDLAAWVVGLLEARTGGTFCATGPASPMTLAEMLERVRTGVSSDAELRWVPEDFLATQGVEPWTELPVWIPRGDESSGLLAADCARARAAGLTFRSIEETAFDTLEWHRHRPDGERRWLSEERERELLSAAP